MRFFVASADCLELYSSDNKELTQILKLEEAAVACLDKDLAAVDGIVQRIVGIVIQPELGA